jgi:hypothetical protein
MNLNFIINYFLNSWPAFSYKKTAAKTGIFEVELVVETSIVCITVPTINVDLFMHMKQVGNRNI